jgi:hypothetical protein
MSIYRSKIFAAAIKLETTSGTDIVPSLAVAADTLRLLNTPNLRPAYIEDGKSQNPQHGGMARIQRYQPKGRWGQVELVVELRGKGSAYTGVSDFVEMDTLLQAAGFNKGFNVSKVEYTTVDSGIPTASLYLYNMAGKLIKMVGCVSKGPKFTFTAGQPATASFTVVGRIASVTEAAPVSPAFNTVMAPVWSDVTVTMGAYSTAAGSPDQFVPRRIEVDVQTTEAARPWAGANALIGYAIVDRQARVSLDMEAVPLASFDPYTLADQAIRRRDGHQARDPDRERDREHRHRLHGAGDVRAARRHRHERPRRVHARRRRDGALDQLRHRREPRHRHRLRLTAAAPAPSTERRRRGSAALYPRRGSHR